MTMTAGLIDPERASALLESRDPGVFAERLLDVARSAAGIDELFAYRIGDGPPEPLASSSDLGDAPERAGAFARRFHRSDPAVAARIATRPGNGFVCRVPAEAIALGAYRRLCFDRPQFSEKICFGWRGERDCMVVTFYHRDRKRDPDMAQLGALAQLAITGLTRLTGARETPPVAQQIEPRLAEAYPVLTSRERQVCARTLAGDTARQIAAEFGLGVGTVLTYRQRAYHKLGISSANGLLAGIMD